MSIAWVSQQRCGGLSVYLKNTKITKGIRFMFEKIFEQLNLNGGGIDESVLRSFYHGKLLYPWQRETPSNMDKQKKLIDQIDDAEKSLTDSFTPETLDKWNALKSLQVDLNGLNEADLFSYSFAMGFIWAVDVMREAGNFTKDGDKS
jgi:hypothetical protein